MKKLLFGIISLCPIIAFAQPQITSISPTTGPVGTSVTITGSGFNTIADSNFVYFNDTTLASVTSATDSSLTVIVPTISSNGPINVINLGNI
ncbi:MAG: IPT/TIG domain-containing protein, partial [Bacteroidia bacterium]